MFLSSSGVFEELLEAAWCICFGGGMVIYNPSTFFFLGTGVISSGFGFRLCTGVVSASLAVAAAVACW